MEEQFQQQEKLVNELNDLQGLDDDAKATILKYAQYVSLSKNGEIKGIGNKNIIITCQDFYVDTEALINLLLEILGTKDVYYLTIKEIKDSLLFNKISSNVIIVDLQKQPSNFQFYLDNFKNKVNSHSDKTFIFVNNNLGKVDKDYIAESFSWRIEIVEESIKNKKKYILEKLKRNNIKVTKTCNLVSMLEDKELVTIDKDLINIIINCKLNGVKTINNGFLQQNLLIEDTKKIMRKPNNKTALDQLNSLIGLDNVKEQINQIINYININKKCKKLPMLHMVFKGPPGCGKTEVARLVGQVLKESNILSKGTFTEVSRSDLIAGYIGQTALKTQAVIEKARGGVLFIDEAYALTPASGNDFSSECISILIKGMEDYKQDLCVILAGYTDKMEELLQSNRGFKSRIQFELTFKDYTAETLCKIFEKMVKEDGYKLSNNIKPIILKNFEEARTNEDFGNGRYVRSFFEKIKFVQADRVVTNNSNGVNIITKSDVLNVIQHLELDIPKSKNRIGFL